MPDLEDRSSDDASGEPTVDTAGSQAEAGSKPEAAFDASTVDESGGGDPRGDTDEPTMITEPTSPDVEVPQPAPPDAGSSVTASDEATLEAVTPEPPTSEPTVSEPPTSEPPTSEPPTSEAVLQAAITESAPVAPTYHPEGSGTGGEDTSVIPSPAPVADVAPEPTMAATDDSATPASAANRDDARAIGDEWWPVSRAVDALPVASEDTIPSPGPRAGSTPEAGSRSRPGPGPRLTPGPKLQPPRATVHSGRASVAPAPFRFDEDIQARAAQAPQSPRESHQPRQTSQPTPSQLVTPPATRAVASAAVPVIPMSERRPISSESTIPAVPPEPVEKPKPAPLRPVAVTGASGRAKVAAPDPNLVPLEPEGPTEAELQARQEAAARAATEQDVAQRGAAQREALYREAAQRDAIQREAAQREAAQRGAAHREAVQRGAAHRQTAQRETARREAAQQETAQQETAQQEAAQQEAAQREAAQQEAAQQEAAQRELMQREANQRAHAAAGVQPPRYPPAVESTPAVPVKDRAGRRRTRIAVLAGIVVVVLVAAGFLAVRQFVSTPLVAVGPTIGNVQPVLAAATVDAPIPTESGLAKVLAAPLRDVRLGTHVTVQVSDMSTGKLLFGKDRFGPTTPASSMKLATAVAALALRGPQYRITTRVVAGPKPGEVVLVGSGDPTLGAGTNPTYVGSARLDLLAAQVRQALGSVAPTKVIIDTSLFPGSPVGPGWITADLYSGYITRIYPLSTDGGRTNPAHTGSSKRYNDSALAAGQSFAKLLGLPDSAVVTGTAPETPESSPDAIAPGTELGSVQSAPLLRIIETMLSRSDNVLAEFVARQVAIASGKPASFDGAAEAVTAQLTKMGMPMTGVRIVDGSGLSTRNKLTPALLSAVLMYAAQPEHTQLRGLFTGLPVAGYSGTLAGRYRKHGTTQADGLLRAKTGTLTGVSALVGTVIDSSGRALAFAVLVDKVGYTPGAQAALDRIGVAIQSCGCR